MEERELCPRSNNFNLEVGPGDSDYLNQRH